MIRGQIHESLLYNKGLSLILIVTWNSLYLLEGTLKLGSFTPTCASVTYDYQMLTNYYKLDLGWTNKWPIGFNGEKKEEPFSARRNSRENNLRDMALRQ